MRPQLSSRDCKAVLTLIEILVEGWNQYPLYVLLYDPTSVQRQEIRRPRI